MNTRKKATLAVFMVVALVMGLGVFLAAGQSGPAGKRPSTQSGGRPSAQPVLSPTDSLVCVYNLQGRVEMVDAKKTPLLLFAPWCPHCQADIPVVQKELAAMGNHRPVILVATFLHDPNQSQAIKQVEAFVSEFHITMPVVIQADQGSRYVKEVPMLIWVDRKMHEGLPTLANIRQALGHG